MFALALVVLSSLVRISQYDCFVDEPTYEILKFVNTYDDVDVADFWIMPELPSFDTEIMIGNVLNCLFIYFFGWWYLKLMCRIHWWLFTTVVYWCAYLTYCWLRFVAFCWYWVLWRLLPATFWWFWGLLAHIGEQPCALE